MQANSDEGEFMQSVWEICGLTAFEPFTLPQWLRDRVEDCFESPPGESPTDRDRVKSHVAGPEGDPWIGAWGKAVISGEEVFVFESNLEPFFGFLNHFDVAEMLECGALFVERSRRYWTGQLMIYTEDRYSVMLKPVSDDHGRRIAAATGAY